MAAAGTIWLRLFDIIVLVPYGVATVETCGRVDQNLLTHVAHVPQQTRLYIPHRTSVFHYLDSSDRFAQRESANVSTQETCPHAPRRPLNQEQVSRTCSWDSATALRRISVSSNQTGPMDRHVTSPTGRWTPTVHQCLSLSRGKQVSQSHLIMARHLPPFGTLKLTREEELAVKQQASAVIQRTLALEIEYRRQGAQVDAKEWKKVSSVDDFHVYKQRRPAHRRPEPPSRRGTAYTEDIATPELFSVREDSTKQWRESVDSLSECSLVHSSSSLSGSSGDEPRVPEILCTGSLEGRLEDFMYGVYDGDDDSWRVRAAYIKDKLDDARILATLERPTQDNPFRFFGIKWFSIEYPPLVGAFIQKRETLVIESMGVATDDQGEQYGYYMMDNFVHSNLPERSDYGMVRNKFKLCFIHRQITPDRIGEYARSYVDAGGSLSPSLTISIAAISLSAATNGVETAYNKKLAWLMDRERGRRRSTATADQSSVCQSCHKGAQGILSRSLTDCHVCGQLFCSKCIVERKLIVDMHASQLTPRALPFCFACVLRAKQLSSTDLMLTSDSKNQ